MNNNEVISMECGETIAAICDRHYSDVDRASKFYDTEAENISGFTGVWLWLRDAAIVFDEAFYSHWEEDEGDYIQAVFMYTDLIIDDSIKNGVRQNSPDEKQWFMDRAIKSLDANKWEATR